jgi:hypothetical protein
MHSKLFIPDTEPSFQVISDPTLKQGHVEKRIISYLTGSASTNLLTVKVFFSFEDYV